MDLREEIHYSPRNLSLEQQPSQTYLTLAHMGETPTHYALPIIILALSFYLHLRYKKEA